MPSYKLPLKVTLQLSLKSILYILAKPLYLLLAIAVTFFTLGLLVWLTNWSLLTGVLTDSSFTLGQKLEFYWNGYSALMTNYSLTSAAVLSTFAILTGLNVMLLVYVLGRSVKEAVASGGKNAFAIAAAAVGAGCAACGTSFLAPVLSGVAGGLSISLTHVIGIAANIIGLGLLLYSIVQLGASASTYIAKERQSK